MHLTGISKLQFYSGLAITMYQMVSIFKPDSHQAETSGRRLELFKCTGVVIGILTFLVILIF